MAVSFAPYTWPMRAATASACIVVAVAAVRRGWLRPWRDQVSAAGSTSLVAAYWVWLVLITAVVAVQVMLYLSAPREVYPTFSSLAEGAFGVRPLRTGAFAFWLWVGWYLVRR